MLFSCSKKNKELIITEPSDEEKAISIYAEAVDALNKGDAFYAGKKFKDGPSKSVDAYYQRLEKDPSAFQ